MAAVKFESGQRVATSIGQGTFQRLHGKPGSKGYRLRVVVAGSLRLMKPEEVKPLAGAPATRKPKAAKTEPKKEAAAAATA